MGDAAMEVVRSAKLFDHSIVRPDAAHGEVARFAETAARLGTATLTVPPHYVQFAAGALRGSGVLVGTVVGFPHGNERPSMKEYQAKAVLDLGAEEIDMVRIVQRLTAGAVKGGGGADVRVVALPKPLIGKRISSS
jgi:deoxyribose-phosphate aldolase